MRILHVGEFVRGGTVTYLRSVVPAQCARYGNDAIFGLIPEPLAGDVAGIFPQLRLARWNSRSSASLIGYFFSVKAAIREIQPDIVHAHSSFAGAMVRLAIAQMLRADRPLVIYCAHGWSFMRDIAPWKRRLCALIEQTLAPLTDGVIHISEDEALGARQHGLRFRTETTIL